MADILSVKCPEYYHENPGRFDLSSYFKDDKLQKSRARYTVLAMTMKHDVKHFEKRLEIAHHPSYNAGSKQSSARRNKGNQQQRNVVYENDKRKVFSIDDSGVYDNDNNAIDIDMNIFNDEEYVTTVSEFENMTFHNKVLYLQSKRSSFSCIPIHQYLQEDTQQFRKKR